ncbi:MAG: DUF4301 family protein [Flavobacteriales bacterium]|nr:DUF4301 family protein [Flavobacteriales bacterium]
MQFTREDIAQLEAHGISTQSLLDQLYALVYGIKPVKLERPCTTGDGVMVLSASECHRLLGTFEQQHKGNSILKFIPASGAASRMFRHLLAYNPASLSEVAEEFILHFRHFPFYDQLSHKLTKRGVSIAQWVNENRWQEIFDFIMAEEGLNYGNCPKGMVVFHRYADTVRTAFEEHIAESLHYGKEKSGICRLHFTLSPDHWETTKKFLDEKLSNFPFDPIEIQYSQQQPSSDVIALDKGNHPARTSDRQLLIRPAGHGALLHNLQSVEADIIYIRNIDNVTTDSQREETVYFKKILAGLLLELKGGIHQILEALEDNSDGVIENALEFIQLWFQPGLPLGMSREELKRYIKLRLDRPLRVCGMVRNEGEPGGGPFWVKMPDGHISKQIIEKSQVDLHDVLQSKILAGATHFNPVDIVCSIRNREGKNYDLQNFVDHSTGFMSEKFHEGRVIKVFELPGLWNGSMALWNSVFVEVPVSTFNPVKTVNDLLRPGHQN